MTMSCGSSKFKRHAFQNSGKSVSRTGFAKFQ